MIVAGVMSGTSADGINVAIVRMGDGASSGHPSRRKPLRGRGHLHHTSVAHAILAHEEFSFPARVRRAVLAAMNAEAASVADLARLNFLLGELYASAVARTALNARVKLDLVGCHGQTIYHQGEPAPFLGRKVAVTWQIGEGAVIAARLGVPVVSDFRPADMAIGGMGAPLVPFLDYFLYRAARVGRIAQNIGGIANLTAIPAGAFARDVIAFDTGPGNMVIDGVMQESFGKPYDRDGKIASAGRVDEVVVERLMRAPFFAQRPPRTAGREEFGREYLRRFLQLCRGLTKADRVATATALTATSIAGAIRRFVLPGQKGYRDLVVSGGGAKNPTLMAMLRGKLQELGLDLRFSDEFGVPAEAKEAVAFAVLAHETWHRRPSNVPSATGAARPAILGKISYV
ncbi:MAG TPA: anhydro-N-acetylmuramic acid kinase [Terriglobales bacterium]|nr:anhydro-N-acetylmuramic acid kinase [Terriglobales bacterium]